MAGSLPAAGWGARGVVSKIYLRSWTRECTRQQALTNYAVGRMRTCGGADAHVWWGGCARQLCTLLGLAVIRQKPFVVAGTGEEPARVRPLALSAATHIPDRGGPRQLGLDLNCYVYTYAGWYCLASLDWFNR
jgi:hypothetical protein